MKKLICLISLILLCGCDITKSAAKHKSETAMTEESETKTFRQGDTVHYKVPVVRYKDTTIYTYNRQGTTLKTVYDSAGQVSDIDCIASAIELYEKKRTELESSEKDKQKEKTEGFNTDWILYLVCGIVVIAIVLGAMVLNKFSTALNLINKN